MFLFLSPNWDSLRGLMIGLGLCMALPLMALPSDTEEEILIVADRAEMDRRQGIVTYLGNVVLTQGTLKIEADRITLHSNEEQLDRAVAIGQPARYQQQLADNEPLTFAHALRIDYLTAEKNIHLRGQAELEQGGSLIRGEHIHYNMLDDIIKALNHDGDTPHTNNRIQVIIQPQKVSDESTQR